VGEKYKIGYIMFKFIIRRNLYIVGLKKGMETFSRESLRVSQLTFGDGTSRTQDKDVNIPDIFLGQKHW
jgi:hypothetical protein